MTCVFCGSDSKLTREHVFGRWLRNYFPNGGEAEYLRRQIDFDADKVHTRPGPSFDMVVRDYCAACNNGWMSELESAAEPILGPMLRGETKILAAPEQHTLATWALKTMLVMQGMNMGAPRIVSPERYRWFGEHRTPLSGTYVWLAQYAGSGVSKDHTETVVISHEWGTTVTTPGEPLPQEGDPINAFQAVFVIGSVVFWLVGYDLPEPPEVRVGSDDAHLLIWPALGPNVAWPPRAALTSEADIEALARQTPHGSQLLGSPDVPSFTAAELSASASEASVR
jgi:hypothetical protein